MIHMELTGGVSLPEVFIKRYPEADGPALKVALFLMLNGDSDENVIAQMLGMAPEVVARSVSFWESAGLMKSASSVTAESRPAAEKRKPRMSHTEMAQAVLSDGRVAALLQESQRLLGRELSMNESRLFIEIYEETSLPVPVLLLIESFWAANTETRKIPTKVLHTAREWVKLGIDTVPAAEERIHLMEQRLLNYAKAAKVMGTDPGDLSSAERKRIDQWFEEYGYDESFIEEVLMKKPDAGIPYIHTVMKDWHRKGFTTISETRTMPSNIQPAASSADSEIDPFILQVLQGLDSEE